MSNVDNSMDKKEAWERLQAAKKMLQRQQESQYATALLALQFHVAYHIGIHPRYFAGFGFLWDAMSAEDRKKHGHHRAAREDQLGRTYYNVVTTTDGRDFCFPPIKIPKKPEEPPALVLGEPAGDELLDKRRRKNRWRDKVKSEQEKQDA
jgi:hypothetical protein